MTLPDPIPYHTEPLIHDAAHSNKDDKVITLTHPCILHNVSFVIYRSGNKDSVFFFPGVKEVN